MRLLGERHGSERRRSAIRFPVRTGREAPAGARDVNRDDALERCIAALYEAALDDTRWLAASALIDEVCGVAGSSLLVGEGFDDDARMYFARFLARGVDREDLGREWLEVYHPRDEMVPRVRQLPHGRLTHIPGLYTDDELKTSPAYNEGLGLLGVQNGVLVRFGRPDGLRTVWTVADPVDSGGWESDRLGLVERLLPHIQRAVLIRQALAAAEGLGAGAAGLMANERIGVVQLDREGRVLEANGPALEILRRGDGLIDRDGALDAWLPGERSRLRRLVGRALPGVWGEPPSGGSMTVQRASGRARLGLHVAPVGGAEADFGGRRVAVLVLVVDPARRPRIDAQRVAAMLGLTPSEGRMAALLAEGLRVREIAAATGWSEDYVRWLSKQAYRKVGATGQVELVRHVLAVDALPRR